MYSLIREFNIHANENTFHQHSSSCIIDILIFAVFDMLYSRLIPTGTLKLGEFVTLIS